MELYKIKRVRYFGLDELKIDRLRVEDFYGNALFLFLLLSNRILTLIFNASRKRLSQVVSGSRLKDKRVSYLTLFTNVTSCPLYNISKILSFSAHWIDNNPIGYKHETRVRTGTV